MPDAPIVSRPFHARMCCERCVFGRGEHDLWCLVMPQLPIPADTSEPVCATFAQTYFIATEQQSQAYRDIFLTAEQQAEMRRGLSVEYKPKE